MTTKTGTKGKPRKGARVSRKTGERQIALKGDKIAKSVVELPVKQRRAPFPLIEKWAKAVCANGDDAGDHTSAFLLILDEIERNYGDYLHVDLIVWTAKQAAFGRSDHAENAREQFIEELRAKYGLRIVPQKKAATG